MIRISNIKTTTTYNDDLLKIYVSKELKINKNLIKDVSIFKRSIDARRKNNVHFLMTLDVLLNTDEKKVIAKSKNNNVSLAENYEYILPKSKKMKSNPIIVGAGPAGLFSALILAQSGANPIIIERGKDIDNRKKDIDNFFTNRILNINSNIQFGEGGAGTFSDGKLTTGTKNPRAKKVIQEFIRFGAPKEIAYNSKPHIGTDKLPQTIKNMRKEIINLGGKFLFDTTLIDLNIKNNKLVSITTESNNKISTINTDYLILAIGHSSRDTYNLLYNKKIMMQQKPFSVGVRIEHLREKIDKTQYGEFANKGKLGASDYKLSAHLKNGRSAYTFCMCPGGTVVAAASEENTVVTNGMSEFARDNINSNSALLVGVTPDDFKSEHILSGIEYQRILEKQAFILGGGNYSAPTQRLEDFIKNKKSTHFGEVLPTYKPSTTFANLNEILPDYVSSTISNSVNLLNNKLSGFSHPDSLLTGLETRSSAPVRILRDTITLQSLSVSGLYPCGEGAGYAGGIMSAAVDGIKCAEAILNNEEN